MHPVSLTRNKYFFTVYQCNSKYAKLFCHLQISGCSELAPWPWLGKFDLAKTLYSMHENNIHDLIYNSVTGLDILIVGLLQGFYTNTSRANTILCFEITLKILTIQFNYVKCSGSKPCKVCNIVLWSQPPVLEGKAAAQTEGIKYLKLAIKHL